MVRVKATSGDARRGAIDLTRGIAATWWYTISAVIFFEAVIALLWTTTWAVASGAAWQGLLAGAVGVVWVACTVPLLLVHRSRSESDPLVAQRLMPLVLVAAASGAVLGVLTHSWLLGLLLPAHAVVLLNWSRGVRLRLVMALTAALAAAWWVDARRGGGILAVEGAPMLAAFCVMLPGMAVLSLWWWDVLVALDRARVAESRLAATQERLRVATDVHDLQGHHLQVIALQLELAEKLMDRGETGAALEQVRAARVSVADATQGTRDLATRFRSAPLSDELANARDLLQAARVAAALEMPADADEAPGAVLGPVIRETTTNVLRHGGGRMARLSLARVDGAWRYEIANDRAGAAEARHGAGLEGIGRRVAEVGGRLDVRRDPDAFAVVVEVPEEVVR